LKGERCANCADSTPSHTLIESARFRGGRRAYRKQGAACNRRFPPGRSRRLGRRARLRPPASRTPSAAVPITAVGTGCRKPATSTGDADQLRALRSGGAAVVSDGGRGAGLLGTRSLSTLRRGTRRRSSPSRLHVRGLELSPARGTSTNDERPLRAFHRCTTNTTKETNTMASVCRRER
jgi:hypothetical protein